jgi:hypothetical protein
VEEAYISKLVGNSSKKIMLLNFDTPIVQDLLLKNKSVLVGAVHNKQPLNARSTLNIL